MIFKQVSLFAMAIVAMSLLSACQDEGNQAPAEQGMQAIPVRVESPEIRAITEWDEFTGRFQASQRVELRARVSGYLQDIKFEDGQIVEKDEVLFVIDQRPFKIAVESAEARFELTNNEYKRAKSLRSSRAISEEDYDQRRQEMRIAKAALDDAKLNLEYTEVKAPFKGRISRSRVDVGNLVSGSIESNATLLTILVSESPIEFYFEGSESDLLRYIRARKNGEASEEPGGHPVVAKLQDEEDFMHEGSINFLDNELAEDTGTIEVRAVFENKDGILEPGMFARLRIAMNKPFQGVLVPEHVIGTEQTRKYIYALNTDNKAVRKYVTLGHITDDNMRVVKTGLKKDDRIIVGNLHMVQPGASVTPLEDQSGQEPSQVQETE